MRWRVIMAAALLTAAIGGGLLFRGKVQAHCSQMEALLLQSREEPQALEQALQLWEAGLPLLSSLLNHEPLEEVGLALAKAKGCMEAEDRLGARVWLNSAMYLLDDIREYDDISWKNLI